jgi:outer membrane lipoprotein-sorting protein
VKVLHKALALRIVAAGCLLTAAAWAQIVGESAELERVLAQMDAAAKSFKTTEASVVWDQYQKVIDETETQKGRIYFRRQGGEVQMAADFVEPDKKYVVYSGGKVQVYQPKIDQVNEYIRARIAAMSRAFWCSASAAAVATCSNLMS